MKHLNKQWLLQSEQAKLICNLQESSNQSLQEIYEHQLLQFQQNQCFGLSKSQLEELDYNYIKLIFDNSLSYKKMLVNYLPKDILSQIENVNLVALGFCTKSELEILNKYKNQLLIEVENKVHLANSITENTQKLLSNDIDFDNFNQEIVYKIVYKNKNAFICFDDVFICIENYKITESEGKEVYNFKIDDISSPLTYLSANELSYNKNDNLFNLSLLLTSIDEYEIKTHWYLTISGSDIYAIYK